MLIDFEFWYLLILILSEVATNCIIERFSVTSLNEANMSSKRVRTADMQPVYVNKIYAVAGN